MEKKEYIKKLKQYVTEKGFTIYDYYLYYAEMIRLGRVKNVSDPFLTNFDCKILLDNSDPKIAEHFAAAMAKFIELQEEKLLASDDHESHAVTSHDSDSHDSTLSRKDIEDVINQKIDSVYSNNNPTPEVDALSQSDILDAISEKLDLSSSSQVKFTSVGRQLPELLDGFAVFKNEKTGKAYLYYRDSRTNTFKGEREILDNPFPAGPGFYVNYQDYLDLLMNELVEKYPTAFSMQFVRDDGVVMSFSDVVEEAYVTLAQHGTIVFGRSLRHKTFKTFHDYRGLGIDEMEDFAGEPVKVGIYVRSDVLTDIFAKYKMRVDVSEDQTQKDVVK